MSYFLLPKTNNDININIQLSSKEEIQTISNCVLQYYKEMCNEIIKIKTERVSNLPNGCTSTSCLIPAQYTYASVS